MFEIADRLVAAIDPITDVPSKAIEVPTVRGALPSIETAVATASVRPASSAATSRSAISNMLPASHTHVSRASRSRR